MRLLLTIKIWREGKYYIAYCPELEVASQGKDFQHALNKVKEAVEAFLEETKRMGTFEEVLKQAGFVKEKQEWRSPLISISPIEINV